MSRGSKTLLIKDIDFEKIDLTRLPVICLLRRVQTFVPCGDKTRSSNLNENGQIEINKPWNDETNCTSLTETNTFFDLISQ
jgi:hypothetical protein